MNFCLSEDFKILFLFAQRGKLVFKKILEISCKKFLFIWSAIVDYVVTYF